MIHSPGSMPSGNFDEPAVPATQTTVPQRSFRVPADYYSAPLAEVKPIFPAWLPWGCGAAAALFLVVLFVSGALLTGPRLNALIDLTLGMTLGELKGMYVPQITEAQKTSFDAEVKRMRQHLTASKITARDIQPFLQGVQKAIGDDKVTPAELDQLTQLAKDAVDAESSAVDR